MSEKSKNKGKRKDNNKEKSNGMVVITYIQGVSERLQRVYKRYNIQTAMKPVNTFKSLLVHAKDKLDQLQTCKCVYEIPRKNCKKS